MWNEGLGHLLAFPCSIDTISEHMSHPRFDKGKMAKGSVSPK